MRTMRELKIDELESVNGGNVIGAVPSYKPPPLPSGLFVKGYYTTNDGQPNPNDWAFVNTY